MSGTIVSLFASTDTGLLDTFGTGGVIDNAPAEFPVPSSLLSLPQSEWSIEQWSQPVALNPGDYTISDPTAYDGLYGTANFTWTEPGTSTQFSIYNNPISLGGGYAYSITNGSAAGEVDFFMGSPAPLAPANDLLNHPITVSLDAKISQSIIQYMAGAAYDPAYVFATVDIGFTLTFDGGGGFSFGAFSGFVQIDPWVTNSTAPVSYTNGPIGQGGINSFIDSKRFSTDPGLPLLPSDSNALPDTLKYNLNNYVYYALVNAFSGFSSADQQVLLNLANWSVGSTFIGIATNNTQFQSSGSLSLAANIAASLELSQISISSNLNEIYDPTSPVASVPVGDSNPQIQFWDYTVGDGGEADGSSYLAIPGIQDKYLYNGADYISLNAPVGQNWEFGGGIGYTTLSAISGNNIFIASSGGSDMTGGSGNDTFVVQQSVPVTDSAVDSILNFHPGDLLVVGGASAAGWVDLISLSVEASSFFDALIVVENPSLGLSLETISLLNLNSTEIQSLQVTEGVGTVGTNVSFGSTTANTLSNLFTVDVDCGCSWAPSDLSIGALINDGTIVIDPTTLTVSGPLSGEGTLVIGSASELIINGPVASGELINFQGTMSTLVLENPTQFVGTIYNFRTQETIDLSDIAFANNGSASLNSAGTLIVIENHSTASLDLAADQYIPADQFYLSSDGLNGTDISEGVVPCLLRGTKIRTPRGDVKIEELKSDDFIINPRGEAIPIKWIGRRRYTSRYAADPNITPILIRAGAIGAGSPSEDLFISPLHAVQCEGWLVAAGALINSFSIIRTHGLVSIDYFHIETDLHEIMFANNLPVETFLDENSRQMFDNAQEYWETFSRATTFSAVRVLPQLESGYELERLRQKYAIRAGVFPENQRTKDFIGYLEFADRINITGWVIREACDEPVLVQVLNSGSVIATAVANRPRHDVRLAGFGSGNCGFSVTLPAPLPALRRHALSVRPLGCSEFLVGSPIVLDPGISHDLLKTGGLEALIEAAVRGAETRDEIDELSRILIQAGKRISFPTKHATSANSKATIRGAKSSAGRILIIDEVWPTPSLDAGSNAIISHVKAFRQLGYSVLFHAISGPPNHTEAVKGLSLLQSLKVECNTDPNMNTEAVIISLQESDLSFVYFHRLAVAVGYMGLVKQRLRSAKLIYSIADLHFLRLQRQALVSGRPDLHLKAKEVQAAEFFYIRMADCVLTHSHYEAKVLREKIPRANIHVVTWAQEAAEMLPEEAQNPCIAFIGGAQHPPNVDAVTHLASEILPAIWKHDEMMKCYVIGDGWPEQFTRSLDRRIVLLGHQENIRNALKSVRLTVAPLRFGAGIKGKVIESFAAGKPCVMSSIAAEGMRLAPELQSVVGDGDDLVRNVVSMYAKEVFRHDIAQKGLQFVRSEFSQKAVTVALAAAIR